MNAVLSASVLISIYFWESFAVADKSITDEQERFSKVRYLITQTEKNAENHRPLFYWESAPSTTSSTEKSQFVLSNPKAKNVIVNSTTKSTQTKFTEKKRKSKLRKTTNKANFVQFNVTGTVSNKNLTKTIHASNKVVNQKKRHQKKRKRKKKQDKKNKKQKIDNDSSVLEIPKRAKNITNILSGNIKSDASIQDVITKLNQNPEYSYEKLLGKASKENEIKISNRKVLNGRINMSSPSLPNFNVFGINSNNNKNHTRVLLETRKTELDKSIALKKSSVSVVDAPAKVESIFKIRLTGPEDKISKKNEILRENNVPKINFSERTKLTKGTKIKNLRNETDKTNNLDMLQTNQISKYFHQSFNVSDKYNYYYGFKCNNNNGGCAQICNEHGTKTCSCLEGFTLASDDRSCFDIDECSRNNGQCKSLCYNVLGSYYCGCPAGLRIGHDLKSCEDINECLLRNGHGPCEDICTNNFGSYVCTCSNLNGTRLAEDKHTCKDVNECKESRSGCSHGCINTHGRSFCTCPNGMELDTDWKTCIDINECEDEDIQKECKYDCLNTLGSYHCLNFKHEQSDQIPRAPENISCPPMLPPRHGFFYCSRKKAALGGFKTKYGRTRVTNRPGTFCELICPTGFKNVGDFRVFCGYDGRWTGQRKGICSSFPKPTIKCPGPLSIQLKPGEEIAYVTYPPPRTNIDWKYVKSEPTSAKNLEMYLPYGHHWITFTATNPKSQLSSKCIIYIVIRKTKLI